MLRRSAIVRLAKFAQMFCHPRAVELSRKLLRQSGFTGAFCADDADEFWGIHDVSKRFRQPIQPQIASRKKMT